MVLPLDLNTIIPKNRIKSMFLPSLECQSSACIFVNYADNSSHPPLSYPRYFWATQNRIRVSVWIFSICARDTGVTQIVFSSVSAPLNHSRSCQWGHPLSRSRSYSDHKVQSLALLSAYFTRYGNRYSPAIFSTISFASASGIPLQVTYKGFLLSPRYTSVSGTLHPSNLFFPIPITGILYFSKT